MCFRQEQDRQVPCSMLLWTVYSNVQKDDRRPQVRTDVQSDGQQGATSVDTPQRQPGT